MIALDTETWRIAPGRLAPRLVCITTADGGPIAALDGRDTAEAVFVRLCESGETLALHNAAFDLAVIAHAYPACFPRVIALLDAGRVWDTMIFEQLRDIARGSLGRDALTGGRFRYSLAALAERHLGETMEGKTGPDVWRLRYHALDGVPVAQWPAEARTYAQTDALVTWRVAAAQAASGELSIDFAAQVRSAFALHLMAAWGLRTDPAAVDALEAALVAETGDAVRALTGSVYRANGTKDVAAVRARVKAAYGDAAPRTDGDAIATDRETLAESGDPVLEALAEVGTAQKILSTYIPALRAGTARPINCRYSLVASGRTSASSPNVQNLPRRGGVRECFVPRPGNVFVAADYSIAELRALAQVLLDLYSESAMAAALQAGRELHLETAAGILGIAYEEAVARYKDHDPRVKDARGLAKAANFGFPGGLGAAAFCRFAKASYGLRIEESAARDLKDAWLERYPEMRRYFADMGDAEALSGGALRLTQFRSGRVRGGLGFCDGCNTLFQGLVADGARAAGWALAKACYLDTTSPLCGTRPVAFIHDEFILEVVDDPDAITAAANELRAVMIRGLQAFVPDIPILVDVAAMRRWTKSAEAVFDAQGRLVPWENPLDTDQKPVSTVRTTPRKPGGKEAA